jgi:hypothetical protein
MIKNIKFKNIKIRKKAQIHNINYIKKASKIQNVKYIRRGSLKEFYRIINNMEVRTSWKTASHNEWISVFYLLVMECFIDILTEQEEVKCHIWTE